MYRKIKVFGRSEGGRVPLDAFRCGECILISRNSSPGIISTGRIHLYLALLLRRDYFAPVRCIPAFLFCSAGIISAGRIHLYLALFLHRDYFDRPVSSLSCSFSPQGLFRPAGCFSSLKTSLSGHSVNFRFVLL